MSSWAIWISLLTALIVAALIEACVKRNRKRKLSDMRPDPDKLSRVSGIECYGLDPATMAQAEHRRLGREGWAPTTLPENEAPPQRRMKRKSKMMKRKSSDVKIQIDKTVKANDVVLYMKGTKEMPQCGFSSRVVGVLNYMGVDFADVNVLADEEVRQGIKDYSDWPTVPQLYVKGEFVGGCDIITEMTLSGELDTLFDENGVGYNKDAADKIREANA